MCIISYDPIGSPNSQIIQWNAPVACSLSPNTPLWYIHIYIYAYFFSKVVYCGIWAKENFHRSSLWNGPGRLDIFICPMNLFQIQWLMLLTALLLMSATCKATDQDFVIIETEHDYDKEMMVLSHFNLTSIPRESFEDSSSVLVK